MSIKNKQFTHLDCFCGAGIGEAGTAQIDKINTIHAFDNNKWAVKSYNHNFAKNHQPIAHILNATTLIPTDLEIDDSISDPDLVKIANNIKNHLPYAEIISGGFPCKPWSTIGKCEGAKDKKHGNLGFVMCMIIRSLQPKAFLIENVDGLINSRNKPYFLKMIEFLEESGFNVKWELINASDYAIAQTRKRVFIVGIRKDINSEYHFPKPTTTNPDSKLTIRDVIRDLPISPNGIDEHECFYLRNDEKPFIDKVPQNGNWRDLSIEDQKAFMGKAFYSDGGRTGALRKVNLDSVAYTILSNAMGKTTAQIVDYGIGEPRRFSIRESLRLQSVPDSFSFAEGMPLAKKYERCSGIPSKLSKLLFEEIVKCLSNNGGENARY
ncbi:DNA cytosine methyltransferase [Photobacterium damselae]|uniref:DNA cytosine methyltransferase n=1 Tax=Photobacterium damselae TaxID=38293 RepID=UPI004068E39B